MNKDRKLKETNSIADKDSAVPTFEEAVKRLLELPPKKQSEIKVKKKSIEKEAGK